MASTHLMTYLNYMATWDTESDVNIDGIIGEQNLFLQVGDFDSDTAVKNEFQTLNSLALSVRDQTIAADAVQIAADAAAIASIWSFGLGMAAFAALQAAELIQRRFISKKSTELNNKLTTIDTDISTRISENVKSYVTKFKANNHLINAKATKGLDTKTCRSFLLQFTAEVHRGAGKLDADTFRKYADSAKQLFNSAEIEGVYDAIDKLNMSAKNEADVTAYFNYIVGLKLPFPAQIAMKILMGVSVLILFRNLKIANNIIQTAAKAAAREGGIAAEEFVAQSAFEAMSALGKVTTVLAAMTSVVDVVFTVLDIVNVVQQSEAMCTAIQGPIKQSYLDYFNGIKEASKQYKAAINPTLPNNTWIKNPNVAQFKEADWSNLKKVMPNTTPEAAILYANSDPLINFFFYCRQPIILEPHGTFFAGTAVFFYGKPWYGATEWCDAYDKASL